jgi:hypothetical protein
MKDVTTKLQCDFALKTQWEKFTREAREPKKEKRMRE